MNPDDRQTLQNARAGGPNMPPGWSEELDEFDAEHNDGQAPGGQAPGGPPAGGTDEPLDAGLVDPREDDKPPADLAEMVGASESEVTERVIVMASPGWVRSVLAHPNRALPLRITLREVPQKIRRSIAGGGSRNDQAKYSERLLNHSVCEHVTLTAQQAVELATDANEWIEEQLALGHRPISKDERAELHRAPPEPVADGELDPLDNELVWADAVALDPADYDTTFENIVIPTWWVENWLEGRFADGTVTPTTVHEINLSARRFVKHLTQHALNRCYIAVGQLHGVDEGGDGGQGKRRRAKKRRRKRKKRPGKRK